MDVVRARRSLSTSTIRLGGVFALAIALLGGAWLVLGRLGPAEPALERSAVVIASVTRGDLVRSVQASGTLGTDRVRIVSASYDGIVDAVYVKPGTMVGAGTIVARMSNPDMEAAVADAEAQIVEARQELRSIKADAETSHLQQFGALQAAQAARRQAALQATVDKSLAERGLIATLPYRLDELKLHQFADQERVEHSKLRADGVESDAKAAIAQAKIDALTAALQARQAQLAGLSLRAGGSGVVQAVTVDPGQRIAAGTSVARVADENELKAIVELPEAQAHDVAIGNVVRVETPSGTVHGRLARIDPSAQNGVVNADVTLMPPLPAGLRPDTTIDATIETARLHDVLILARPAGANDESTVDLFKVVAGGTRAVRVPVHLGSGSLDRVAVRSGLAAGDRVIVSDTSAQADATHVRLQ